MLRSSTLAAKYPRPLKWVNKALDLLFPPVCAVCGTLGPLICDSCAAQISKISEPLCQRCGRSTINETPICSDCIQPSFLVQQVRAPLAYQAPLSIVIHRLKYEGLFALAKPLSQIMVDSWPVWEHHPDAIVPVPLHQKRQRLRGFNQSQLLAEQISQQLLIPMEVNALKRIRHTKPQIGLNPSERQENVRDAFTADPLLVSQKQILLVDDVYTSGATMAAAALALLDSGAANVSAYCLARTV